MVKIHSFSFSQKGLEKEGPREFLLRNFAENFLFHPLSWLPSENDAYYFRFLILFIEKSFFSSKYLEANRILQKFSCFKVSDENEELGSQVKFLVD
jgi:hypothetical protein